MEEKHIHAATAFLILLFIVANIFLYAQEGGKNYNSLLLTAQVGGATIGQYEIYELTLQDSGTYANPYTQATVSATFTGTSGNASGKSMTIKGFWDGGDTWKIRFAPPYTGTYSYQTSSSDSGLNNKSGAITAVSSSKKGRVTIDPSNPLYFKWSNGDRYLMVGDTWWDHLYDSGTPANEKAFTDTLFNIGVNTRINQNFNYAQINIWYSNTNNTLHGETSFTNGNKNTINPEFFQYVDSRIQYAADKNFIIGLLLGWADDNFYSQFTIAQRHNFAQYIINRYAAYPVIWVSVGEYNEYGSETDWDDIADYFRTNDPYNNLTTIHPNNEFPELDPEDHLDFYMVQKYTNLFSDAVTARSLGMPYINGEYGYEPAGYHSSQDAINILIDSWRLIMGGSAGLVYGNFEWWRYGDEDSLSQQGAIYTSHLADFWNSGIQYWKFNSFIDLGSNRFEAKKNGLEHVYWTESSGAFAINLSDMMGTVQAQWYNATNGTWGSEFSLNAGSSVSVTPPASHYALRIWQGTQSTTPTPQKNPPAASISQPSSNNGAVSKGSTVQFGGTATDADSSSLTVGCHIDRLGDGWEKALIKQTTQAPGQSSGSLSMAGSKKNENNQLVSLEAIGAIYELVLVISDGVNPPVEARRSFVLVEPQNIPPTISLTSPSHNSSHPAGSPLILSASASDSDGTVTKVEFFRGTTLLGTDTSFPHQYTWPNPPAGTYTLVAKATDNNNTQTISQSVGITITSPQISPTQTESPESRPGWTFCSYEFAYCDFSGAKEVQYGLAGHYTTRIITDGTACGNEVFPDPYQGYKKQCFYRDIQPTPSPTPTQTTSTGGSGGGGGGSTIRRSPSPRPSPTSTTQPPTSDSINPLSDLQSRIQTLFSILQSLFLKVAQQKALQTAPLINTTPIQPSQIDPCPNGICSVSGGDIFTPTSPSTPSINSGQASSGFNRNLTIGSQGEDVRQLQIYLNQKGFLVATSGAGSPNNETTLFGQRTQQDLSRFQQANGINPPQGYFGPFTREYISGNP